MKRSRNVGVCIVGCPRTATKSSSSSTGPPIPPFYLVFCGFIGLLTSSGRFSARFIAFLPLFFSSHHSQHPLLKVNKTLSNLSGSRSRLYLRCNTVSGYFFPLDFWVSCPYSRLPPICNSPCLVISSLFLRLQFAKLRRYNLVFSLLRKLYVFCKIFRTEN